MAYRVTFWGTRGSIPTPGRSTARYGGNTPCIAVENSSEDANRLLILDAGTGIRPLGRELSKRATGALDVSVLLSHTHWDHIQGLPFFEPFFGRGNAIRIWGPQQGEVALEAILKRQWDPAVFPIPLEASVAELTVEHIAADDIVVHGFRVQAARLRHPGRTLAYRLTPDSGGASFAYVTDNELSSGGDYDVGPSWREGFVHFLHGVEILVHDAMYTPEELEHRRGWGHSSYAEAVTLAVEARARRLVLFHHRPEHDDAVMDTIVEKARGSADALEHPLEVIAAAEGMHLTL